jgi:glucose-1-phosphate thymidylyltransferase
MGQLHVEKLGRGYAWLDTGTPDSLADATNFVRALEQRQSLKVCCPEEIAFVQGFIDRAQLRDLGLALQKSTYGRYLLAIADGATV